MSRIGLIINDKSNRSASLLRGLLDVAKASDQIVIEVLDGIAGLNDALKRMNQHKIEVLILAGGDGTLQAVFTDIMNNHPFDVVPKFAILPFGMTNVIANDCGLKGAPAKALSNFLNRYQSKNFTSETRNILSITSATNDNELNSRHGFFLGAAGFHNAVKFSRKNIQTQGAKRSLALVSSVFGFIANAASNPSSIIDEIDLEILEGHNSNVPVKGQRALLMMTTLKKCGASLYPFWGNEYAAIKTTLIEHPAKKLLAAAPWVPFGKERKWFKKHGINSWNTDKFVIRFAGPYVFDGEIYHADENFPLTITKDHSVTFLT